MRVLCNLLHLCRTVYVGVGVGDEMTLLLILYHIFPSANALFFCLAHSVANNSEP